jgi:hypothetical protein
MEKSLPYGQLLDEVEVFEKSDGSRKIPRQASE